jgi:hypothetical protein|uniref:Uncharacterized protein n=1 Tax=Desulfobacca acetoxidans TaxID=60893 RepID=A0A7C3Z1V6_9BACT
MQYRDLAEHLGAVLALLGVFAGLSGSLLWRMLVRLEKKLDQLHDATFHCQAGLADRFVGRSEFRKEKEDLWGALNSHSHSSEGRVVR